MSRYLALFVVLAATGLTLAQQQINWLRDPRQAVQQAQSNRRPIMVYVLAGTRDRDDDIERDQRRSLSDPRILRLAREFVPLRLSRSMHRDILEEFGLPQSANMMMSFMSNDGHVLDTISAMGVAQVDSLAQKLVGAFKSHLQRLFDSEVQPVLTDENAKPNDLRLALRMVIEFRMQPAEGATIALLERPRLNSAVRKLAYDALAALSTKTAVDKLLDLAWDGDQLATKALSDCTPMGAEFMLEVLKPDAEFFPLPGVQSGLSDLSRSENQAGAVL